MHTRTLPASSPRPDGSPVGADPRAATDPRPAERLVGSGRRAHPAGTGATGGRRPRPAEGSVGSGRHAHPAGTGATGERDPRLAGSVVGLRPGSASGGGGEWERELRRVAAAVAVGYPAGPAVTLPPFRSAAEARVWLARRLPELLAVSEPEFALRLATALGDRLDPADAVPLLRRALLAGAGAPVRLRLGCALRRLGRHTEAAELLRAVLPELRTPADRAAALLDLAACREHQGRHLEAQAWYVEAYEACLHADDPVGCAISLRHSRTLP